MRLYKSRVEPASQEMVRALAEAKLVEIEADELEEVFKDVESVLNEYIRSLREITERAKDIVSRQGLGFSSVGRIKRSLAKDKKIGIDDDALDHIIRQIIEQLEISAHVDELYGEDHEFNRIIAPILKKHMDDDTDLDQEVRKKIKHLSDTEGSVPWEIEYQRIKQDLARLKKLD